MGELNAKLISEADENPHSPFFSPDGQWIGYVSQADQMLKKVAISGGAPVILCNAQLIMGASWSADDTILYGAYKSGIFQVSADGGNPEPLFEESSAYSPRLLPDGKTVMFTDSFTPPSKIVVYSLESGERSELLSGSEPYYLSSGHILYNLENAIYAVPFDLERLETTGGAFPLVEGVNRYAISDSGTLVYIPGRMTTTSLLWVDRDGKEEPLEAPLRAYAYPRISPDGSRAALSIVVDGNEDIYNYDFDRGTATRLTFDEARDFLPIWTPDNQRIIFQSNRGGKGGIYWKAADGTGKVEQIASVPEGDIWPWSISRDGNTLFFDKLGQEGTGAVNIGTLSMEGDRTTKLLLQAEYYEGRPEISPDGRWLAYMSNELGQYEVFIRPFPDIDSGGKWQASTSGGTDPRWSRNGETLFYRSSGGIMAVSVETDPTFGLETPDILFPDKYSGGWDIHPDGRRFLMLKPIGITNKGAVSTSSPKINIILNWFEELKDRVLVD